MFQLETTNFGLRCCQDSDLESYLQFWNDPQVMQFIGDGTWGGGSEVVQQLFQSYYSQYKRTPKLGFWAVIHKKTGQLIGEAGLCPVEATSEIESGYLIRQSEWGKGYATEIQLGLLEYGFLTLKFEKIMAVTHPMNLGSKRVLEKAGFQFLCKTRYHDRDSDKYEITRNQWLDRGKKTEL